MALRVFSKGVAGWGEGPKFRHHSSSLTSGGTLTSPGAAVLTLASVNEKIIFLPHPTVLGGHETPIRMVYKETLCNPGDIMGVLFIMKGRISMVGWLIRREEWKLSKMIPGFLPRASVFGVGKRDSLRCEGGVNSLNLNRIMAETSEDVHRRVVESGLKPWWVLGRMK